MADLTRRFNWSGTVLGTVENWPEALLITVNILLQSRQPMILWWGEELIQFYNDAYRLSLRDDRHPNALGQPGRECWSEVWHIAGPQIDRVLQQGEATWHEDQLVPIHRNGKLETAYWTYGYSPVCDSDGKIRGVLVISTETTSAVLARQQSKQEMDRLASLFHQAPVFFAVLAGPEFIFELVNERYQELIGHRDVLGKTVLEGIPEAGEQGFIALLQRVFQTGEPFIGRNTPIHLARSGHHEMELHYLDFVYQPRREADGSISGIIVLGTDVTDKKRTEQVLLQSEKLNAVGRLASSIAHEINNPLEAVTNLVYLAQRTAISPEAQKYLEFAEVELQRTSAIVNQTLRFHRQSTNQAPISARDLIDSTLSIYKGRLRNLHIIVERRDRTNARVTCFDGEIRQILNNLISNAIDAMRSTGGRLLIRSREATNWQTGSRNVVLTVADNGIGMAPATRSRIFEPFFTTKQNGTGLGLWISREILDRHKGVLRVKSRQAEHASGTVFTLSLPLDTENV